MSYTEPPLSGKVSTQTQKQVEKVKKVHDLQILPVRFLFGVE
jgi:hypothetical protein